LFRRENIFILNKKPLSIKVQAVIDYCLGLSYRKIKQKLYFLYGIKVDISSIFEWVKAFQKKAIGLD
jgi:transposase